MRDNGAACLEKVIREHGPRLEAYLRRRFPILANDTEDILAEAIARAWSRWETFDPSRGTDLAWLTQIAHNTALALLRKRAIPFTNLGPDAIEQLADPDASVEGDFWGPKKQDLLAVLNQLSEEDRTIILRYALVDGEGPWAAELAREMNLDAGLIRVRRLRILERIRAEMRQRGHQVAD